MAKSNLSASSGKVSKPAKPSPDFPLFAHTNGRWAKKVKGKIRYFGPWNDPDGALQRWLESKAELEAGKEVESRRLTGQAKKQDKKPARHKKLDPKFPLWIHAGSKQWAKKVKGKLYYFGSVEADPTGNAALENWLADEVDLKAGRTPRRKMMVEEGITVAHVVNHFLTFKEGLLETGEIAQRTFNRYYAAGEVVVSEFGRNRLASDLQAADFQAMRASLANRLGPVALGNEIQMVRSIFGYAFEMGLLEAPIRFGPGFKKPSAKVLRKNRIATGPKLFTPAELRAAIKAATVNMKAMILLGINGGLGNLDLAELPMEALDLENGWLNYPRSKTAVNRRIPLWPETVKAIRKSMEKRAEPKDPADNHLLFIGRRGISYVTKHRATSVSHEAKRAFKQAGAEGRNFYDLRRTFQTIGEGAHDLVAVQAIMGHAAASSDMSAVYRQEINDSRLRAVVSHVRSWLLNK